MPKPKTILEPTAPKALVDLQTWMSKAVTLSDLTQNPALLKKTTHHLTPSKTLTAQERLEIYINDYWPRCLESLEEDLPLLHQFWGPEVSETWMTRYLDAHPSSHPSLFFLGNHLEEFLTEAYTDPHRDFILNLVHYEWTKALLFIAKKEPSFDPTKLTKAQQKALPQLKLTLQPNVDILSCMANYSVWKPKLNKLPKLRPIYLIIYQNQNNKLQEETLPFSIYTLLNFIKKGYTLEKSLAELVPILEESQIQLKEDDVQNWLSLAVKKGWLCHPKGK